MNEDDARTLLLIRAVETEDAAQALLTRDDRQAATASALSAEPGNATGRRADQRFLASRAAFALARLTARHPAIGRAARATRWPGWLDWALPLAAIALGVATNELAGGQRLNIIAFPLFGILLWNLAVYLLIAAHAAGALFRRADPGGRTPWTARAVGWASGIAHRDQDPHHPIGRAIARFARDWARHAGALTYARAARLLHLSAAALAVGVVAGMYLRALGVEYRAGWESTFIGAATLQRLLGWVLAPASILTGIALPDEERLAALRWGMPANGENAGPWIHLYATTAMLYVVLPRLALAAWSALSAERLRRFFKVPGREDFYVRRVLRDGRGGGTRVRIVPYGFTFPDAHRRVLERLLRGTFGDDTAIETEHAIAYAGEEEWLAGLQLREDDDYLVALFNLAATPEAENHGELLAGIRRLMDEQRSGTALAALLDETAYRARLGGQAGADGRIETRRTAWERMMVPMAVSPIAVDLGAGESPEQSRRLEAALLRGPVPAGAGA
jgi:hypothetical protein